MWTTGGVGNLLLWYAITGTRLCRCESLPLARGSLESLSATTMSHTIWSGNLPAVTYLWNKSVKTFEFNTLPIAMATTTPSRPTPQLVHEAAVSAGINGGGPPLVAFTLGYTAAARLTNATLLNNCTLTCVCSNSALTCPPPWL